MLPFRLLHSVLLVALVCMPLSSRAHHMAESGGRQCELSIADGGDAAQREAAREAEERIHNVLLRGVQREQAGRRQAEYERQLAHAGNTSTHAPLCPLLLYTPQLLRDEHLPDHFTLRLANLTATQPTSQHIDFVDAHYSRADGRLLSPTSRARVTRLLANAPLSSIDKLELPGVVVHKGEALRLVVVYSVDSRECNDAPTVLFVDWVRLLCLMPPCMSMRRVKVQHVDQHRADKDC